MNRTLSVMLFAALIFMSGCVSQPSGIYENTQYGYKVNYAGWEKVDGITGVQAAFVAPPESATDSFQESVTVAAEKAGDVTLEEYTARSLAALAEGIPDFELVSADDATLGGLPAGEIVYTGSGNQKKLKLLQIFTLGDGNAYVVTYAASEETFDVYLDDAAKVINSFTLTEQNKQPVQEPVSSAGSERGEWRIYSSTLYYDAGGSSPLDSGILYSPDYKYGAKSTRTLSLDGRKWRFGDSSGTYSFSPVTDADWKKWGIDPYGATRKITLSGWNDATADGPVDETETGIDFIWVIYRVEPPVVQDTGTVWVKFGH